MCDTRSHNNNGLFRRKRSRLRRSNLVGKSFTSISTPLSIKYRAETNRLKHRKIRRRLLNGAGDQIESRRVDFDELEQIFDRAIRAGLPIELHRAKLFSIDENQPDTRLELFSSSFTENDQPPTNEKYFSRLIIALVFISSSAIFAFLLVFTLIK